MLRPSIIGHFRPFPYFFCFAKPPRTQCSVKILILSPGLSLFVFYRFIGDGFYVVRTRYGTACREKEVGRQGRPYSKITADNFKLKLEFL